MFELSEVQGLSTTQAKTQNSCPRMPIFGPTNRAHHNVTMSVTCNPQKPSWEQGYILNPKPQNLNPLNP